DVQRRARRRGAINGGGGSRTRGLAPGLAALAGGGWVARWLRAADETVRLRRPCGRPRGRARRKAEARARRACRCLRGSACRRLRTRGLALGLAGVLDGPRRLPLRSLDGPGPARPPHPVTSCGSERRAPAGGRRTGRPVDVAAGGPAPPPPRGGRAPPRARAASAAPPRAVLHTGAPPPRAL